MHATMKTCSGFAAGAAVAVLGAVLLAGCGARHQESAQAQSGQRPVVKGVGIETVTSARVPETVELPGTVRSRTTAVVSPRIPGLISSLKVREGDRVRKGQLLGLIESQENQAGALAADAGVEESQRALDEALTRKRLAEVTFERYRNLFSEQAVTRQEYDIKQTERDVASQGVARAEARLRQAREGARAASTVAGYTQLLAPISGIVSARQADQGSTVFPGQPLLTIDDDAGYQLELAVPESMAVRVKAGTTVHVTLDAVGGPQAGRIAEIVPAADPASRTFTAKVPLAAKGLKSGMFGRGSLTVGEGGQAITLPKGSVMERGALTSVWVVAADNSARLRLIKAGRVLGDRVEVLSGLSDGDRVVVSGGEKITEGARIE